MGDTEPTPSPCAMDEDSAQIISILPLGHGVMLVVSNSSLISALAAALIAESDEIDLTSFVIEEEPDITPDTITDDSDGMDKLFGLRNHVMPIVHLSALPELPEFHFTKPLNPAAEIKGFVHGTGGRGKHPKGGKHHGWYKKPHRGR